MTAAFAVEQSEWHWSRFTEFCLYEMASGGPDPHMRYVGEMSKHEPFDEKAWRIGLYVAFYNVPTAEVIWKAWSWKHVWADMNSDDPQFPDWLAVNWPRFQIRRERRAARTVNKMTASLKQYIFWLHEEFLPAVSDLPKDPISAYEVVWDQARDNVPYFGRYALTKLLEGYLRAGVRIETPDIRPNGGWSPRTTLNLLSGFDSDPQDNRAETIRLINAISTDAHEELAVRMGFAIDYFRFEVMLCEYHESYHGKRQYPGRSNDSELSYLRKIEAAWPEAGRSMMYEARRVLCPPEALGEAKILGERWDGVRPELGLLLSEQGKTWSDLLYRYNIGMDMAALPPPSASDLKRVRILAETALLS